MQQITPRSKRRPRYLSLIVLLAMALRFYRLETQSFWNDEGNTARLVERTVALIIEGAAGDIHPPGYYLLLHAWRVLAGQTEFALRSYSAFCGLGMVAVAIALGRRSGGWIAGLVAGTLVTLHPLAVAYSQEARMYAQLGLVSGLTLLTATTLVRRTLVPPQRRGAWQPTLALALCIAVGLYTQYTYILALVGLNLAFGALWLIQRPIRRGILTRWLVAHALGGALFLPWAPIALSATGWQPPDLNQGDAAKALAQALFLGTTLPQTVAVEPVLVVGAVLLMIGIATHLLRRPRLGFAGWGALSMATVPAGLIAIAGIYRPAYLKFLLMSVVPLGVAWALPFRALKGQSTERGAHKLAGPRPRNFYRRWLPPAIAALLLAPVIWTQVRALDHLYHDPTFARDDYRGLAAHLRTEGQPGDAILLSAPNQWEVFTYYYGAQPDDTLPVYPAPYRPTEDEAADWVSETLAMHPGGRIFVLYWGDRESDPERHLERALATQAYKAGEQWVTTVRLAQYGVAADDELADQDVSVQFGTGIALEGARLPTKPQQPTDIVPLSLTWEATTAITERLKVFVHLVDSDGVLRAQVDMEPRAGFAPTSTWQPGDRIRDHYGVLLPDDLAPGDYVLLLGMYQPSGERLPVTVQGQPQGDTLSLAPLRILAGRRQ